MDLVEFLRKLPAALNASAVADTSCVLQFTASKSAYVAIKGGACTVTEGTTPNADATFAMDQDDDLIRLLKGQLDGMSAFMSGQLRVEGDLMLAQQVTGFFDPSRLT